MSEVTIEQLQEENTALKAELDKVKAKNVELLAEKKKVSGISSEAQEKIDALEGEKAELQQQIHHHTVVMPRQKLMESITPNEHLAGSAIREILHHFDIGEGDKILKKDGTPVYVERQDKYGDMTYQEVQFDEEGIVALYEDGILPALGSMLSGSKASGGNAPGNTGGEFPSKPKEEKPTAKPAEAPTFGMR